MENRTEVSEFILMGLTNLQGLEHFLFALFLLLYVASLLGNGAIVAMALMEPRLHTPMYFFLGNLSCLDICYSTVTVPKMLSGFLSGCQTISFAGCLAQLHFFHFLGSSEAVLLAVMAYDRYVAICNPLRYRLLMSTQACLCLAAASWVTGFLHALMHTIMTSQLCFCGPSRVPHFFCDIKPLLSLACGSTRLNLSLLNIVTGGIVVIPFILTLIKLATMIFSSIDTLPPFLLTLASYVCIISTILRIPSTTGRQKAFSTCSSHLMVVTIFYGTVIIVYMLPDTDALRDLNKVFSVFYMVLTPLANPLIYSLRNKEVKEALSKIISKYMVLP
uniref:Olfactory receptor n=1 Tax=Chelydra serpentina TaxID=8475 RepID=A0A8C3SET2_CHESE